MSTQMAVMTLSGVPAAQAKPGAGKSAHGFGAEMQNALASAAPLSQNDAAAEVSAGQARAGQAAEVPGGTRGAGHPEGFGGVDLLTALGIASPAAASAMASDQPAASGVQSFLPGSHADASLPGAAQTFRPAPDVGTQDSVPAAAGSSAAGTAPGVPALQAPAAAAGAAAAGETEGPTAAELSLGARQLAPQGGQADSTGAAIPAPAPAPGTGAGPAGQTAAQAQQGSAAAPATASIAPGSNSLPDPSSAQLFAVAGQQPAASAPAPAPATPAPPAPAASPPLSTQLQGPLFSLASAKPGEHTMTLSVTPENLGPVTVRAQIGADGVRVELFAANDAGREALRAILQDLKRDLASAGFGAELDLSSQNQPDEPGEDGPDRRAHAANQEGTTGRQLTGPGHHSGPYRRLGGSETGLDVLA